MNCEIIAVGSELTSGEVKNTNAAFLSQQLTEFGITVTRQTAVDDNPRRITEALKSAVETNQLVIFTGGLGPTPDDLTKETVSKSVGLRLIKNSDSLERIREYFDCRGLTMPENNRKQAYFPEGAIIFVNHKGTADGCAIESGNQCIMMLPGPPGELEEMFNDSVHKYLSEHLDQSMVSCSLKAYGMGESLIAEKLDDLLQLENPVVATYIGNGGDVRIKISSAGGTKLNCQQNCEKAAKVIKHRLGSIIYDVRGRSLQEVVVSSLKEKHMRISTAESCTAGLLSKFLTDVAGASDVFEYGISAYANRIKTEMLGVPAALIEQKTAVSPEVARAMAKGARTNGEADIAIGITGYAGPESAPGQPAGLVYICLYDGQKYFDHKLLLPGKGRDAVRETAVMTALNMVRLYLENNSDFIYTGENDADSVAASPVDSGLTDSAKGDMDLPAAAAIAGAAGIAGALNGMNEFSELDDLTAMISSMTGLNTTGDAVEEEATVDASEPAMQEAVPDEAAAAPDEQTPEELPDDNTEIPHETESSENTPAEENIIADTDSDLPDFSDAATEDAAAETQYDNPFVKEYNPSGSGAEPIKTVTEASLETSPDGSDGYRFGGYNIDDYRKNDKPPVPLVSDVKKPVINADFSLTASPDEDAADITPDGILQNKSVPAEKPKPASYSFGSAAKAAPAVQAAKTPDKKSASPAPAKKKKKTFKDFCRGIFPWKGDKPAEIVRKIILIICVIVFIGSATYIVDYFVESIENKLKNEHIAEMMQNINGDLDENGINKNFYDLLATNPDTVGWLKVPNTQTNNPVVQTTDNSKYLSTTFEGEHSKYGTIFADCNNVFTRGDNNSTNIILYGHHMKDGSMMGELKNYRNADFYKENPVIEFTTKYSAQTTYWKIFSVFIINTESTDDNGRVFNYLQTEFDSEYSMLSFADECYQRSIVKTANEDVVWGDKLLTLSTCVYDFNNARLVIMARRCRTGEEPTVDTSDAGYNSDTVYPQAYYDKTGKSGRTEPSSYVSPYKDSASTASDNASSQAASSADSTSSASTTSSKTIVHKDPNGIISSYSTNIGASSSPEVNSTTGEVITPPDTQTQPETPAETEPSTEPEAPAEPEEPVEPVEPIEPDTPAEPDTPDETA